MTGFSEIIQSYQAMQARAEQLINTADRCLDWREGVLGFRQITDDDIRLDFVAQEKTIRCSGTYFTMATGGSQEFFDVSIPVSSFDELEIELRYVGAAGA